jgi:hypothetical protein
VVSVLVNIFNIFSLSKLFSTYTTYKNSIQLHKNTLEVFVVHMVLHAYTTQTDLCGMVGT